MLLLALLGLQGTVHSAERSQFHQLPLDSSLAQNTVTDIVQDQRGLLWVGTLGGLHRYDGYQFELISSDPRDPNALSGIDIARLLVDRDGILWVGGAFYSGGWLNRLDPLSGAIEKISGPLFDRADQPGSRHIALHQGRDGAIWIGTNAGLHRLEPDTRALETRIQDGQLSEPIGGVLDFAEQADGLLWVASTSGVLLLDPRTQQLQRMVAPDAPAAASALLMDDQQNLWIGEANGVRRWSTTESRWLAAPADVPGAERVSDLLQDRSGTIWVAYARGGLSQISPAGFQHHREDRQRNGSLSISGIWSLYEDRSGLLWLGTAGAGLNQRNASVHRFNSLTHDPVNDNSLSHSFVWDLQEDSGGRIWIATPDGINRYTPESGEILRIGAGEPLRHMQSLQFDTTGTLWAGTASGHLYRLPPGEHQLIPHGLQDRASGKVSQSRVWYLGASERKTLWMGLSEGLYELDPRSGEFSIVIEACDEIPMGTSAIRTSLADTDGGFWFGGGGAGLIHFDRDQGVTAVLGQTADQPDSLSNNQVRSLYLSPEGHLWVGTHNGLNLLRNEDRRARRNRFTLFTVADGLPNNTIYGIVPDPDGKHLWLSTNAGLSRMHMGKQRFRNFSVTDGLAANELNGGAELQATDGTLYFGTVNGLSWMHPGQMPLNQQAPQVMLTGLRHSDDASAPAAGQGTLRLPHDQANLELSFAAADFHQPSKNRFRYRLTQDQAHAPWQFSAHPEVSYARLAPGQYRFEVHASNNDGVWSQQAAVLEFEVTAPWWWNPLAWMVYLLGLLSLLAAYHWRQRKRLRQERAFSARLAQKETLAAANEALALRYAQYDQLTQLPNRDSLLDELAARMRDARQTQQRLALLLVDLDQFKKVNDRLGHKLADRILQRAAERLQNNNPGAFVARISSDEFALLLPLPSDAGNDWLQQQAASQHRCLARPFELGDPPISLTATIGVAVYGGGAENPTDLLGHADLALHGGKSGTETRTQIYQPGMREQVRESLGIEARIQGALESGEFQAYYQPVLDLATEQVVSFEALIRWFPASGEPIYPDQFIPLAEHNGQIVELGRWMLVEVGQQLAQWRSQGRRQSSVAVNVSLRQLRGGQLVHDLRECLRMNRLPGDAIKLEITETAMMENVEDTAEQLLAVQALGVQISIDDFGTGFSSLAHLKQLPVDELKIDRSFVSDLSTNAQSRKIVASIVNMAHALELRTVAEGAEDQDSIRLLKELGCDLVQGYYYAKPMAADALLRDGWLRREPTGSSGQN